MKAAHGRVFKYGDNVDTDAVSYTHLDVYKRQGQAFLELHPTKYAAELVKKMEKSGAKAYLVNSGWNGTGKRITIKDTRGIIDAILSGDILNACLLYTSRCV